MRKKVLGITGTKSGIGKAIAVRFSNDFDVISFNRPEYDVRKLDFLESDEFNRQCFDVFINNAGIMPLIDFDDMNVDDWDNIINTNLRAPFFISQNVIPKIVDGGHLINISSVAALKPESLVAYSVSKAGLTMLTRCLASMFGDRIHINTISPGFITTNLVPWPTPDPMIESIPLKREGTPEEVADLVWYLVHQDYINGSDIKIDGGLYI